MGIRCISVIVAIALIFFYLLYVVMPLFLPVDIEQVASYDVPGGTRDQTLYDVGLQNPNVEAARPLVYATALLLVLVIAALNITAVAIRNRRRERYRALEG